MLGLIKTSRPLARVGGALAVLTAVAFGAGCNEPFAPFNELDKLRVLAVQAEPPALGPGEVAQLEALVFEPDGDPISYRWSWCPFSTGSLTGYECLVDEDQVREMIDEVAPGFGALFPGFELGTAPTASLVYPGTPELLAQFCAMTTAAEIPAFADLPACDEQLTFTIRLEVTAGGESVTAVKELPVYFDAARADNENPTIGEVTASREGEPAIPLLPDEPSALVAGRRYRLDVTVPAAAAQTFVPPADDADPTPAPEREYLFMSWFVTGGDTENTRTTFIDDEISLAELGRNSWRTPDDAASARLYLVLQDERGGVSWTERELALEEQ